MDSVDLVGLRGLAQAIDRSQAVIEFDPSGVILTANRNFLDVVGYRLGELQGQHHRVLCDAELAASEEYRRFWDSLAGGAFESGEFSRLAKGGKPVWLQATYNPVIAEDGTVVKIVKLASDITESKATAAEFLGKVAAMDRSQAVVEFSLDGRVLTANRNFLDTVGYTLAGVQGKHHRIFCDREYTASADYREFWDDLSRGEFLSGEFRRVAKDGREVWLQATYNPIMDPNGNPVKVVKYASDITVAKARTAEFLGKVAAIDRSQAVIEFSLDGTILTANSNFLQTMGYSLAEVQGKHHRMFCEPGHAETGQYREFWERLGAGEFETGEYKRLTKDGREVWLQASYNPIMNPDGVPVSVVKFASDVTAAKVRSAEVQARVDAVDRAQAAIEFDLEGVVLHANENFLRVMGFSLREVVGQHHSTFCTPEYTRSVEYRDFWLRLGKGEVIAGRFHRVGKYGRDVHIQATYNPILDLNGAPVKIVKYAYDVSAQVEQEQRVAQGTQDMTACVRELAGSIEDIAINSTTATSLAAQTHDNAQQGVQALQASLEAIGLIQSSSSEIGEIVRVMGEIASQTNLLAFNASIEAARAGEHGVGFSIVAGEVRKLAERSSQAAQQIGDLIKQSATRVDQGADVSQRAEDAFKRIVTSVEQTRQAIATISESTRVQQAASQQVNTLISQLSTGEQA
ncbi:PAS domain S-box protein [Aquipuribacter hungaricus]|uniref:methyl-accepting chemotaxis protein n=1 Tax=Aquipuribacter hungaricus TaxID=545624 RepID=UPI0030EBE382